MLAVGLFFTIQPFVSTRTALLWLIGAAMLYVFWQMVRLMLPKKSHKYTGGYDDEGLFHGDNGKLEALNGDVYEGAFVHGYFAGKGKYTFKKHLPDPDAPPGTQQNLGGGSYEGQFREGHFWGVGKETYPDGSVYDGDFVQGKRHGKGRIVYATGTSYTGEWRDGKKHGKGMIAYADGNRFEGWFVDGNRHGVGKLKDKRGKKTYAEWEYGQLLKHNVDPALYRSSKSAAAAAGGSVPPTTAGLPNPQPSSGRLTPRDRSRSSLPSLAAISEVAPGLTAPAAAATTNSSAAAAAAAATTTGGSAGSAAITIEAGAATVPAVAAAKKRVGSGGSEL